MEEETPLLTVIVPVYNEEDYVEECVRSIAAQKVNFPIEVLVGDDCSPDGTAEVLRRLEPELPSWIHIFYRDHNLGDWGDNNIADLLARSRGKYLTMLEGDDFWTYPGKLQAQVEFMEGHPNYSACYHHCTVVGADSRPNGLKYPECLKEEYDWDEFFYMCLPGQLGTVIYKREEYLEAKKKFLETQCYSSYPGDRRMAFLYLSIGKVHVIQEAWSAYRHIVKGGTSYSANVKIDDEYARQEVLFARSLVRYAERINNSDALFCAKRTYYRLYLKWSHGPVAPFLRSECMEELQREPMPERLKYRLSWISWYVVLGMRSLMGRTVTL